jgi:hypothetical protein
MRSKFLLPALALFTAALLPRLSADPVVPRLPSEAGMKPEDTDQWKPVPTVVTAPAGGIPSDATVLFDGRNLDAWAAYKDDSPAPWKLEAGAMVVVPGAGDIRTKASFGDIQLHLEFCEPAVIVGNSQGRGNSGVLFMGLYELQVLDSHDNPTYVNGQAGAVYKQFPPLVNASRLPGEWQTYDAVWIAPRFTSDGKLASPARLTVFHNGVLVQLDVALLGQTRNVGHPLYVPHPAKLPLVLQEHHNPVAFRNIWVRELSLPESK